MNKISNNCRKTKLVMNNIECNRCKTNYRRNGYGEQADGLAASIIIFGPVIEYGIFNVPYSSEEGRDDEERIKECPVVIRCGYGSKRDYDILGFVKGKKKSKEGKIEHEWRNYIECCEKYKWIKFTDDKRGESIICDKCIDYLLQKGELRMYMQDIISGYSPCICDICEKINDQVDNVIYKSWYDDDDEHEGNLMIRGKYIKEIDNFEKLIWNKDYCSPEWYNENNRFCNQCRRKLQKTNKIKNITNTNIILPDRVCKNWSQVVKTGCRY